jgi:AraC family transcriptional regulator
MTEQPEILTIPEKKLVGKSMSMSIVNNKTGILWGSFMPQLKAIKHRVGTDKISLQVYSSDYFKAFNPNTIFTKWAAVPVSDFNEIAAGLSTFVIDSGKYAVFQYKGEAGDNRIFQYIYSEWLPKSGFQLDQRPHFEVLGAKYDNTSADSEEAIYIPIK